MSTLMAERVTGPLGMTDTAFGAVDPSRLTTAYRPGPDGPELLDPPDGVAARPPAFERLSGGLVSTAPDVLRFFTAMADGPNAVLTAGSEAAMTADALTPAQRRQAAPILGAGASCGFGTAVDVEVAAPWQSVGRWGWNGGTGTTAFVDPARDTVAVLLTQRGDGGPAGRVRRLLDDPRGIDRNRIVDAGSRAAAGALTDRQDRRPRQGAGPSR